MALLQPQTEEGKPAPIILQLCSKMSDSIMNPSKRSAKRLQTEPKYPKAGDSRRFDLRAQANHAMSDAVKSMKGLAASGWPPLGLLWLSFGRFLGFHIGFYNLQANLFVNASRSWHLNKYETCTRTFGTSIWYLMPQTYLRLMSANFEAHL